MFFFFWRIPGPTLGGPGRFYQEKKIRILATPNILLIMLGPGELKRDLASTPLMQQYFSNAFCFPTEDIHVSTVERVFKDYLNRDIHVDPIILYLEELIQKGKNESLVFGLDDVENTY